MANLLVVAVDTGNKNIKTPHTEPFNSGLICHGNIPPAIKADTLCYEGNYYTLTQSRVPYMYDKTSDWSYYVLTLFAIAKELERIATERKKAEENLQRIEAKLANESFTSRAPENVVNAEREKAEKARALIAKLDASAAAMKL